MDVIVNIAIIEAQDNGFVGQWPAERQVVDQIGQGDAFVALITQPDQLGLKSIRSYRQTIEAIEAMQITPEEKRKIYIDNALSLLRIPA